MLKQVKLKNSTILFLGIVVITIGIGFGLFEYFLERKDEVFSDMNILLYESEIPENIESDDNLELEIENEEQEINGEVETPQKQETTYNYVGILEIPKINLKRGFLDINSKYNKVNYNVTVINGSTFPDQNSNNLILAAHSGSCKICYFDKLYKLQKNDQAYVYYKNKKYVYSIVNIYEVEKDGTVPIYRDYDKNTLTLITCTRNSDTKQTVYILELVN